VNIFLISRLDLNKKLSTKASKIEDLELFVNEKLEA